MKTINRQRIWLKEIRKSFGYSQRQVSKLCEMPLASYGFVESGRRGNPLNVNTAKKIAAILGFDWTRFYSEDNNEKKA